jgi:EAL and modified HD-GYP domain-containing signal transduction protein
MEEIFVTRQAIYDSHCEVVGYELLYHDGSACHAYPCTDAEQSAQLIINTFMGIGLENLVGSNKAFISLSHDFFSNEHPIPMASYQLVLEVSGECIKDARVYQELKQLSRQGYTFSLYDYDYDEASAGRLDCIDIVKIDIEKYNTTELKEQTRYYRNHGKRLQIKGLTSDAQQLLCKQLGIDYFQGDLLAPADCIKGHNPACDRSVLQALTSNTAQPADEIAELACIISHDVVLCYKLLRYINCASFSERTAIHTIEQALTLIGSPVLKKWAALLLTAQLDDSPSNTLNTRALVRANMCRDLAQLDTAVPANKAFMVGLLSTLDEALLTPLEDLLDSLALSPDIAFALLFGEGQLGGILQKIKEAELVNGDVFNTLYTDQTEYSINHQTAHALVTENNH